MGSREDFETLIPDKIRKKLQNDGVPFSELRQASKTPENLIEAIYRYWRGGNFRIERNGNGTVSYTHLTLPTICSV